MVDPPGRGGLGPRPLFQEVFPPRTGEFLAVCETMLSWHPMIDLARDEKEMHPDAPESPGLRAAGFGSLEPAAHELPPSVEARP